MASYDISGDAPIKIEASPALDCIAQIEKLKDASRADAEGAATPSGAEEHAELLRMAVCAAQTARAAALDCSGAERQTTMSAAAIEGAAVLDASRRALESAAQLGLAS